MMFSYIVGTFDLDIVEATGKFASFSGGHNRMVDMLHQLPDGSFVEHCICYPARCIAHSADRRTAADPFFCARTGDGVRSGD